MSTSTVGLGGFGLLIAPVCPCAALITENGELVIRGGEGEVARLAPGHQPAAASASWTNDRVGQFGSGGPTLTLANGVRFEDVFARIDVGLGDHPWCALGPGFVVDLLPGLLLLSAAPDDPDPMFELHLPSGGNELIRFIERDVPVEAVQIEAAPYQKLIEQRKVMIEDEDGCRELRITELAYEHRGVGWRQLAIAAPLDEEGSMVLFAQAREERAPRLFDLATKVAASLAEA